jgi:exonuclease III
MFLYFITAHSTPMALLELEDELDNDLTIECHALDVLETCQQYLTHNHKFKVVALNVRSIQRNFDSFFVSLKRLNIEYDVIILSECWLSDGSLIDQMPGYQMFQTTKIINKSGGVVAYVKEALSATCTEPLFDDANCLAINIQDETAVLGIYRSPSFTDISRFLNSLDTVLNETGSNQVIIAGDLNVDISNDSSTNNVDYLHLMAAHGFLPAITKPTRNGACLDHIFIKANVASVGIVCKCSVTDHDIVMAGLLCPSPNYQKRDRWVLKTDYIEVARDLGMVDWSIVTESYDVNIATNNFNAILRFVIQKHTKRIKISRTKFNFKPWVTPGVVRCIRHKDKLHKETRASPNDPVLLKVYTRYRNFCDNL